MREETGVRSQEAGGEQAADIAVWVHEYTTGSNSQVYVKSARAFADTLRKEGPTVDVESNDDHIQYFGENQINLYVFPYRDIPDFCTLLSIYEEPYVEPAGPLTVKQIVADWLKGNGFDGLCKPQDGPDSCGCDFDTLFGCMDGWNSACECVPAFKGSDGYYMYPTKAQAEAGQ